MTEPEALLISIAVEAPVAWLLARGLRWPGRGPVHVALAIVLATAATHPQLWAGALALYPHLGHVPTAVLAEAVVVVVEAAVVAWAAALDGPRALAVSLVANAASVAVGMLLTG